MYKGTEIINYMESHLGNRGAQARAYCGLSAGQAWCNAEVTYAFHEIGESKLYCDGRKEIGCPHSIKWCYANLASLPIYLALEGDVVYFDWDGNGVPNHIGFARHRINDLQLATVEGNTAGGQIANVIREAKRIQAVFRPLYPVDKKDFDASKELELDGCFGFSTIAVMQKFLMIEVDGSCGLKTVKAWQKFLGVKADGDWQTKTTKATQKLVGVKVDGYCGKKTVIGLQKWLNKQVFRSGGQTTKPTATTNSLTKVEKTAKELAWSKGTAENKYAWKGGSATKVFKEALNKYFPTHSKWSAAPSKGASCDVFAGTVVRASGLDKSFPRGFDEQWTHKPSDKMQKLTFSNVTPWSVSKPGDVILYWKNSKGTSKHVLIRGKDANGKAILYEAQYEKTYGHVNSSPSKIKKRRPKVVIFRAK